MKEYGLFLVDEDPKKGVWLEAGRSLEYYMLRSGVGYLYFILTTFLHLHLVLVPYSLLLKFDTCAAHALICFYRVEICWS